jgi:hypothetical protein
MEVVFRDKCVDGEVEEGGGCDQEGSLGSEVPRPGHSASWFIIGMKTACVCEAVACVADTSGYLEAVPARFMVVEEVGHVPISVIVLNNPAKPRVGLAVLASDKMCVLEQAMRGAAIHGDTRQLKCHHNGEAFEHAQMVVG